MPSTISASWKTIRTKRVARIECSEIRFSRCNPAIHTSHRQAHVAAADHHCGHAGFRRRQRPVRGARRDRHGQPPTRRGERDAQRRHARLALNSSVFLNEVVSTAQPARLGVTFTDNTRLTLGEKAKLTLDNYVFDSAAGKGTIRFGLVGAFRFVSGQVSKLASPDVSVTTPVAVVGIRGTEFWGGPIDDQALGVFLIEGAVSVSNAAGQQVLNLPGQGTNIAAPCAAPGPVTFWPPDKSGRARATVTVR